MSPKKDRALIGACVAVFLLLIGGILGMTLGCNPSVPGGCPTSIKERGLIISGRVLGLTCCAYSSGKHRRCTRYCYPYVLTYKYPYDLYDLYDTDNTTSALKQCIGAQRDDWPTTSSSQSSQAYVDGQIGRTEMLAISILTGGCDTATNALAGWYVGLACLLLLLCILSCFCYCACASNKSEPTSTAAATTPLAKPNMQLEENVPFPTSHTTDTTSATDTMSAMDTMDTMDMAATADTSEHRNLFLTKSGTKVPDRVLVHKPANKEDVV